jgi:hypothetical protein
MRAQRTSRGATISTTMGFRQRVAATGLRAAANAALDPVPARDRPANDRRHVGRLRLFDGVV